MKTLPVIVTTLSVILVSSTLTPSFALGEYDYLSEWGEFGIYTPGFFSYPEYIAVDEDGNSYISDLGNKRIQKFSSDGQYISHWGGYWKPKNPEIHIGWRICLIVWN
ncbi:NHL repeat-containing protein [Marine Group I thaumarchaeote SCGC RSA3]|uniref:NHL repeat-containing protein n=1 Tax=Marine Group I thaumarchaeote SCGC RSA3 TaxID=1503183 RepID=A0A087RZE8_9ARCH|nr:NHL repeat-containing protein [Marine Group I thaumarchaeote SCGC RSA3]